MKSPDVRRAVALLRDAIELHEKHMDGRAPTTGPAGEKSQEAMMVMMRDALTALTPSQGILGLVRMQMRMR